MVWCLNERRRLKFKFIPGSNEEELKKKTQAGQPGRLRLCVRKQTVVNPAGSPSQHWPAQPHGWGPPGPGQAGHVASGRKRTHTWTA